MVALSLPGEFCGSSQSSGRHCYSILFPYGRPWNFEFCVCDYIMPIQKRSQRLTTGQCHGSTLRSSNRPVTQQITDHPVSPHKLLNRGSEKKEPLQVAWCHATVDSQGLQTSITGQQSNPGAASKRNTGSRGCAALNHVPSAESTDTAGPGSTPRVSHCLVVPVAFLSFSLFYEMFNNVMLL